MDLFYRSVSLISSRMYKSVLLVSFRVHDSRDHGLPCTSGVVLTNKTSTFNACTRRTNAHSLCLTHKYTHIGAVPTNAKSTTALMNHFLNDSFPAFHHCLLKRLPLWNPAFKAVVKGRNHELLSLKTASHDCTRQIHSHTQSLCLSRTHTQVRWVMPTDANVPATNEPSVSHTPTHTHTHPHPHTRTQTHTHTHTHTHRRGAKRRQHSRFERLDT